MEVRFRNIDAGKNVKKEGGNLTEEEQKVLHETATTLSVYRVNFLSLAVGPIHHSIELVRAHAPFICGMQEKSRYLCRFSCDIHFVQTQKVEVQLYLLKTAFLEKNLNQAYQSNFSVITYNGVSESTKSSV